MDTPNISDAEFKLCLMYRIKNRARYRMSP